VFDKALFITAYNKPECLYMGLDNIKNDLHGYKVIVLTQEGYDKEQDKVLEHYKNTIDIERRFIERNPKDNFIGMRTILSCYTLGAELVKDYIILLEEDIIPTKDYIKFNEILYNKFLKKYDRIFCGAHKRREETEIYGDPRIVIGDYQCTSPTVVTCDSLRKIFTQYVTEELYQNTYGYYYKYFGNSRIHPGEHMHQDGFIERVMEKYKLFSLKPDLARSSHVGLNGATLKSKYISPEKLEDKLKDLNYFFNNHEYTKSLSSSPRDIVFAPDSHTPVYDLEIDHERNRAVASSWWYDYNNEFSKYVNASNNSI